MQHVCARQSYMYESVCLNEYRNRVKCDHTDSDLGQWGYFLLNNNNFGGKYYCNAQYKSLISATDVCLSTNLYEFVRSTSPNHRLIWCHSRLEFL